MNGICYLFCFLFLFIFSASTEGQKEYDSKSLDFLIENERYRVIKLLSGLNLEIEDLHQVRTAFKNDDLKKACVKLIDYYNNKALPKGINTDFDPLTTTELDSGDIIINADEVLRDTYTFQGVKGEVEKLDNGNINWAYNGPKGDKEWGWFLNRHYIFTELLEAYLITGNSKYVAYFNNLLIDWVLSNPPPDVDSGTPQWRVMEVGSRMLNSWTPVFYGFRSSPEFTITARIMMLYSILEQQEYILEHHEIHHNHAVKEMNGLAQAAVCFTEFKDADYWIDYSKKIMLGEVNYQVYPDNVHKELSSAYHENVYRYFKLFVNTITKSGYKLPTVFLEQIENMADYMARSIKPTGYAVQSNDSDRRYNLEKIKKMAADYNRDDWRYISTFGEEGITPEGCASTWYPWGGQLFSRNRWHKDAHWSYFDIGPWGTAHQHYDKLHVSISAFGRDLLIDAGRYVYKKGPFRSYFVNSESHNVILIDGKGQIAHEKERLVLSDDIVEVKDHFDFAFSKYDSGFENINGSAIHKRALLYIKNEYWIIVDFIDSDLPRDITALWHFDPKCNLKIEEETVTSIDENVGNLRIVPISNLNWDKEIVIGQTEPVVQGWHSLKYNSKTPSPVIQFSANIENSEVFGWLFIPAKGNVPKPKIKLISNSDGLCQFSLNLNGIKDEFIFAMDELIDGKIGTAKIIKGRMAWIRNGVIRKVIQK